MRTSISRQLKLFNTVYLNQMETHLVIVARPDRSACSTPVVPLFSSGCHWNSPFSDPGMVIAAIPNSFLILMFGFLETQEDNLSRSIGTSLATNLYQEPT